MSKTCSLLGTPLTHCSKKGGIEACTGLDKRICGCMEHIHSSVYVTMETHTRNSSSLVVTEDRSWFVSFQANHSVISDFNYLVPVEEWDVRGEKWIMPSKETTQNLFKGLFFSFSCSLTVRSWQNYFTSFLICFLRAQMTLKITITMHDPIHIKILMGKGEEKSTDSSQIWWLRN